jgi:hypothetical protein
MNQIVAITRYHIPLRTLIADFDVRTDRRLATRSSATVHEGGICLDPTVSLSASAAARYNSSQH